VNWGESIFIQGVNQINPIDVPAARRAGAELKEILMPVWMAYANWGFSFGSVEAFYQLKWNNTSVDGCGTYFTATSTLVSADPGSCRSLTPIGGQLGAAVVNGAIMPQTGSLPYIVSGLGLYVPAINGDDRRQRPVRPGVPLPGRQDRHGNRPVRDEHPQPPADHFVAAGHQPERPDAGAAGHRWPRLASTARPAARRSRVAPASRSAPAK